MRHSFCIALLIAALGGAACDNGEIPTEPDPTPQTETFTGTLSRGAARTHSFRATDGGSVTATLTSIAPDSNIAVGFALGTWDGSACSLVVASDAAKQSAVLNAATSSEADLCVRISDAAGAIGSQAISYTITVVHP